MSNASRGQSASPASSTNVKLKENKRNKKSADQKSNLDFQADNTGAINITESTQLQSQSCHDEVKMLQGKIKILEEKFKTLEISSNSKLDALYKVLEQKDEVIGKLNVQIGELKQSCDYLTKETSDIKQCHDETTKMLQSKIDATSKFACDIKAKTVDLEDRSRRNNLVFYNFEESEGETPENCEQHIINLVNKLKILPDGEELWIERAHRLGKKTPQCKDKPRPIIAKFTYYKHKNEIIKNGWKFKSVIVNVSEDYSRETLNEHRLLRDYGKKAAEVFSDPVKALLYFKVAYRRLVVTYSSNKKQNDAKKFVKTFTLNYIRENPYWFKPQNQRLD